MIYRSSKIDLKNECFSKNCFFKGIKKKIVKKYIIKNLFLIIYFLKMYLNSFLFINKKIFLGFGFVLVLSVEDYNSLVYWFNSVNENNNNKFYYISFLCIWVGGNRNFM